MIHPGELRPPRRGPHTSLEIAHPDGPIHMIAMSRKALIPRSGGRVALRQHENRLIDVDDHPADRDEIEKPFPLGMGAILNAEQKCNDGNFTKSDGVQYDDLTQPGPFVGRYNLGWGEVVYVVAESVADGHRLHDLSHEGEKLPSLRISCDWPRSGARRRAGRLTKVTIAQK